MTQSINELMKDVGDCRKAPATPGLLITLRKKIQILTAPMKKMGVYENFIKLVKVWIDKLSYRKRLKKRKQNIKESNKEDSDSDSSKAQIPQTIKERIEKRK